MRKELLWEIAPSLSNLTGLMLNYDGVLVLLLVIMCNGSVMNDLLNPS